MARQLRAGVRTAVSPNDRLQQLWHPWTSYLIVPLFALANAGIRIDPGFLAKAYASPITLGVVIGYVLGKPIGVMTVSGLVNRATKGRLRPPVGWVAALGGGTLAGMGFTVSLLVASVAFTGNDLKEATLGVLTAAVLAAVLTWLVFQVTRRLAPQTRIRALLGQSPTIVDLADPVDVDRDHIRGPADAHVTLVEYGDFECPYCGQAEPIVRELLADFGDLRYVWRHLPLNDVHPRAQLAAEASEAAGAQGAFWPMHDLLIEHQGDLNPRNLMQYAEELGLDVDSFTEDLKTHRWSERVAADVESADVSEVAGTPSFFVNGQRQVGAYDITSLSRAVRTAQARAQLNSSPPPDGSD
jgi:protein-disulfide isomerase